MNFLDISKKYFPKTTSGLFNLLCKFFGIFIPLSLALSQIKNKQFWKKWAVKKTTLALLFRKIYCIKIAHSCCDNISFYTQSGFLITCNIREDHGIARCLFIFGHYEAGTCEAIEKLLPKQGVFFDAGAHLGIISLTAARKAGPRGKIISAEPNPDTFSFLIKNAADNNFSNIIPLPYAISNKDAATNLIIHPLSSDNAKLISSEELCAKEKILAQMNSRVSLSFNTSNFGKAEKVNMPSAKIRQIPVLCKKFETIIQENNITQIDILKIDIEGAEMAILDSLDQIKTFMKLPLIIIECSRAYKPQYPEKSLAKIIYKYFNTRNWLILKRTLPKYVVGWKFAKIETEKDLPEGSENIYCIPPEKQEQFKPLFLIT